MKKRFKIIGIALLQTVSLGMIAISSPIWVIIWLFSGYDILSSWYKHFVEKPIKKLEETK